MSRQAADNHETGQTTAPLEQRNALNDGIGERRSPCPVNQGITSDSPGALAPWPTREVAKWLADRRDRYLPRRGNRALLARVGPDPQARLTAVTHECVLPALRAVRATLAGEGREVELEHDAMHFVLRVRRLNGTPVEYAVGGAIYEAPVCSLSDLHGPASRPPRGERRPRVRIASRGRARECPPQQCSEAAMYRDALHELRHQLLC